MAEQASVLREAAFRLRQARHVVVLTGAGVSAESGVPTFRDAQIGLWAQYDPQELATLTAFRRNPKLVWEWYAWRRELVAGAAPNPGHYALAEIEKRVPRFTLITQNIDGLHQKGGVQQPIELHGNLETVKCLSEDRLVDHWEETGEPPPRCPHCGGLLRPNVVWFGEALPVDAFERALHAARTADLFLTIGTSGIVYPAAGLPFEAIVRGAVAVEINPNPTSLSEDMAYVLRGPSGVILPALVDEAWPLTKQLDR
jgi:NAD-dependent deacetylase